MHVTRHQARDNEYMEDKADTVIITVPFDAVRELEHEGLAFHLPVFRGAALEAVVSVGMDSAALVTLLQAPDSVRAFAAWIRHWSASSGDSIVISAKRGGRQVHLKADGNIDVHVVANFLVAAFEDHESQS
jgi:hypothetical protein